MLENIPKLVAEKLKTYQNLSFLERYAMFMGKAQILEMGLKNILARDYGFKIEEMEKWTLGKISKKMASVGVRPDFIEYLNSLVEVRNYIAHELLAKEALLRSLINNTSRLEERHLERGIYELEQLILIFDWQEENFAWGVATD